MKRRKCVARKVLATKSSIALLSFELSRKMKMIRYDEMIEITFAL